MFSFVRSSDYVTTFFKFFFRRFKNDDFLPDKKITDPATEAGTIKLSTLVICPVSGKLVRLPAFEISGANPIYINRHNWSVKK